VQEETGFSPRQVERLYARFLGLDKQEKGHLSRSLLTSPCLSSHSCSGATQGGLPEDS